MMLIFQTLFCIKIGLLSNKIFVESEHYRSYGLDNPFVFFTIKAYDFFYFKNDSFFLKSLDQARVGCVLST